MTWNLFCDPSKRREDWERSIFVRLKEGGYRLRENILFHLYVSTSPCGDARLNSPYEITTDCKEKSSLSYSSFLCVLSLFVCVFGVFLRSDPSCCLSLLAEIVSLESKNAAGFRVCVSGAWSCVLGEGVQGKSELGKAAPHTWGCVALLGNTSLHFLLDTYNPESK